MWVGSLISAVLGNILPGAGTYYRSQSFDFAEHAQAGEELIAEVTVKELRADREVLMNTIVTRKSDGAMILSGEAVVIAPEKEQSYHELELPGLIVQRHRHFERLWEAMRDLPPMATAVVAPEEPNSLGGALAAKDAGIIDPILIGDPDKITAAAAELDASLDGVRIEDVTSHRAAAGRAVGSGAPQEAAVRESMCFRVSGHVQTNCLHSFFQLYLKFSLEDCILEIKIFLKNIMALPFFQLLI